MKLLYIKEYLYKKIFKTAIKTNLQIIINNITTI